MQIDGTNGYSRMNPYSRSAAPGNQPQSSDKDGAVSDGQKPTPKEQEKSTANTENATKMNSVTGEEPDPQEEAKIQQQIQELLQIQNKVIVHEQAHMSAGGELAGGASYTYTTGPDGKRYISGGEVSISTPAVKEPEEKIRVMAKVQAAALAPADPSPQDMRVASSASAQEAQARMELARMRAEAAYGGNAAKSGEKVPGLEDAQNKEISAGAAQKNTLSGAVRKKRQDISGSILDFSV